MRRPRGATSEAGTQDPDRLHEDKTDDDLLRLPVPPNVPQAAADETAGDSRKQGLPEGNAGRSDRHIDRPPDEIHQGRMGLNARATRADHGRRLGNDVCIHLDTGHEAETQHVHVNTEHLQAGGAPAASEGAHGANL